MITREMLIRFYQLNQQKKRIEEQLDELKNAFNHYFDLSVGFYEKGEITVDNYKLQRQIRTLEKYEQEETVKRLECLHLNELIQKKPDDKKIKSAIDLGLLSERELDGCKKVNKLNIVTVKSLENSH
ncbi:hypothetical protein ACA30_00540 [Virgibacillus soli]|uniref:Uncharacterized protein n=1 Tax=Lederbergia galactosidilytica TaxID=217031 RepID=A0A0Q9Y752_9BACI|nr:hypothetical protein ACA30_00540 [Virgibacillus soli]KRG16717.1 hypothetical protein ACA29_04340 [Lederbergia galactosidilytica]OAK67795.1 hypothetical protein ABB05_18865 [Lederbergia galactosidilytica]